MSTETYQPVEDGKLVQGSGVVSTGGDGQTITAAQLVAQGKGDNSTVIGAASEAIDLPGGGSNALVGAESAVVDLDDDADQRPKFGHNVVAKIRWDWMARLFKRRPLTHSAGYRISAQPDTAWENGIEADPGSINDALLQLEGNPGLRLARISGDMVVWQGGVPHFPVTIDGAPWGIPLTFLGGKP